MRKIFIVLGAMLVLGLALSACTTATPTEAPTTAVVATAAPTGRVQIRWYIGLGTGTDPAQLNAESSVVNDFNNSQSKIQLIQEVVAYASGKDVLSTEIASGDGPDIIGPVGWAGSNAFYGQYLDFSTQLKSSGFDTSVFNPALVKMYETSQGTVGLPFAVYPSAFFYNTALFDAAGLAYPPAKYGDKYTMPDGSQVDWTWDTVTKVSQLLTVDKAGKNATEAGFDKTNITQYGFSWVDETQPSYWGTYWGNGSYLAADGKTAQAPDVWVAAWKWTYNSIWGDQPFQPNAAVAGSADFGTNNTFNSGKIAMTDEPVWYTCCMGNVKTWDAGIMPMYNGVVAGRIDADTFRIWKGTKHPDEAFQVLAYIVTTGLQKLIIGSKDLPPAYGALPARTADLQTWIDAKKVQFPWVKNWQTILDGLNYPDVPSAEAYMPNFSEAWTRGGTFANLVYSQGGLDIDKEIATFISDLNAIFAKAS
jgi:multiple sugar transport system substrate-binding protein